jgi:TetR/AcrR family transcriptional repressor of mexJK operon
MSDKNTAKVNLIVRAAKERFARYGFSKVTMDEIAADVELGKASLYYYFPAKEDLFRAVIKSEQEELLRNLLPILDKKCSAAHKLELYIEIRLQYFQILLNLGSVVFFAYTSGNSLDRQLFVELERQELHLIEKIIEMGIQSNEFDAKLCKKSIATFLHLLHGLRLRFMKIHGGNISAEMVKELEMEMRITTDIYIRGIKSLK